MPTVNQLVKFPRLKKKKINRTRALEKCPQKKGVVVKIVITTPRKPNSALRKVARIRLLSTKKLVSAYICGEGHNLQKYSNVLMRGGRIPDLPGIKYRLIRGKYDFLGLANRVCGRSKYGRKKPK
jgi:small subunit ribosomal protein S12